MAELMHMLTELRARSGAPRTLGLTHDQLKPFASDPALLLAASEALERRSQLDSDPDVAELFAMSEDEMTQAAQEDFLNFYDAASVNPYTALAARGPWLITSHGAVLHDSGGYGMLGMGHGPQSILDTMAEPWVMANVMTPSLTHLRFTRALKAEVGHTRGSCPFHRFIAMNSGSEAVTVGTRISDVNAREVVGDDGREVRFLVQKGAFHGRTDRPAQASDSSMRRYRKHLKSFHDRDNLTTVPPNDVAALEAAFAHAEKNNIFFEMMLIEPVMGEGNPGLAMTREFYDTARRLTLQHNTLLLVDSIQAGIRTTGHLSIVDYPGFEDCEAPDLETYSKALNAGQYPMSILAVNERASHMFRRGIYGNTMTTNPRCLEVATAVLKAITPELRKNIQLRGKQLLSALQGLQTEFPDLITMVQGTGLLVAAEITPDIAVVGFGGLEEHCRVHGMGVIHGGRNALRFTPHFNLTSAEVELMVEILRSALQSFQLHEQTAALKNKTAMTA